MAVGIQCISEDIIEVKLRDVTKQRGLSKAKFRHGIGPVNIFVGIDHPVQSIGETKEVPNLVATHSSSFWVILGISPGLVTS